MFRSIPCFLFMIILLLGFLSSCDGHQEKEILLEFKSLLSDPSGILANWVSINDSSHDFSHCSWYGVVCDPNFRVSSLQIPTGAGAVRGNHNNYHSCFNVSKFPFYGLGIRRSCSRRDGKLVGKLSPGIARLKKLRVLSLPFHVFSGEIPSGIWGLEGLEVLDLEGNLISGQLPVLVKGLRRLRVLNLGLNKIGGKIPDSFSGLVGLEVLNLAGNELHGVIPRFIGGYKKLWGLYLSMNRLTGEIPDVWGSNCWNLRFLDLSSNSLNGEIPTSLGNCPELRMLLVFSNALKGVIPRGIGRLRKLEVLDVSRNVLGGHIPPELGKCGQLSTLVLSSHDDSLSTHDESRHICGRGECNLFKGPIPMEITNLPKLRIIWAPKAGLEGKLRSNWISCDAMEMINLSQNFLSMGTYRSFEGCENLVYLDLGSNKLPGKLTISGVSKFTVSICDSLPALVSKSLQLNRVSDSYLSFFVGRACSETSSFLPKSEHLVVRQFGDHGSSNTSPNVRRITNARSLSELNTLQSNTENLQPTEDSPLGDGTNYGSNKFNSIEIASIVSASVIVLVLLALVVLFIYTRKCAPRDSSRVQVYERREIKVFTDIGVPLTYQNVVKATDCFSAGNCIGCGGFGATYKAEISPGVVVAVKRLAVGRFHCIQQFHAEIKTLGRIRHENLVTLIGYHASETEMFLIYNYLPGGNLEKFIQERATKDIKWNVLHKIALNIAHAIAYLHDVCNPRVIHRDVKPSNILLDNNHNAYLSDFGLSRLLENSETHATTGVAGTFGYLAPEYAMTCRVSEKADVYSYGVVLLELISDKKALDPSFASHGNGFNIVSWAHMLLRQGRAKEVFTPSIWNTARSEDLVEVLHLAVKCTVETLTIRPTMKQAVNLLEKLSPPPDTLDSCKF